ncbi:hypothetical protein [Cronobacter phage vB_Cdu_VP8]|nr:hypothetical protein [Cronobacter phage vB_Cdu_VP8]
MKHLPLIVSVMMATLAACMLGITMTLGAIEAISNKTFIELLAWTGLFIVIGLVATRRMK